MADSLPQPSDCCEDCTETVSVAVPGPAGAAGAAGTNGTNGKNAFTTLTANFTMPAALASGVATVADSSWATIGQFIYLQSAGHLKVLAKPTALSLTLENPETASLYTDNVAGGTVIANGSTISPAGIQGPAGAAGAAGATFPTTTKGDIMVDNGALSPNPSVVRQAVGTNGRFLQADSTQATGVVWDRVDLAASSDVTGVLPVANGGTSGATALAGFNALSPVTTRGDLIVRDATNNVRLAVGAANTVLQSNGTDPSWGKVTASMLAAALSILPVDYILIREEQTSGTNGGTFTNGAWQTRVLNTEVVDTGSYSSIAGNQITLAAGTYRIRASAPASEVDQHQMRLQNITDATTVAYGSTEDAPAGSASRSFLQYRFTIATAKVFEIQHRCTTTVATTGFGTASGFGNTEVYTVVELEREGA